MKASGEHAHEDRDESKTDDDIRKHQAKEPSEGSFGHISTIEYPNKNAKTLQE
jgi:hypothetical protein